MEIVDLRTVGPAYVVEYAPGMAVAFHAVAATVAYGEGLTEEQGVHVTFPDGRTQLMDCEEAGPIGAAILAAVSHSRGDVNLVDILDLYADKVSAIENKGETDNGN